MLEDVNSFAINDAHRVTSFDVTVPTYPIAVAGDVAVSATVTGAVGLLAISGTVSVVATVTGALVTSAQVAGDATATATVTGALVLDPLTLLSTRLHFHYEAGISPYAEDGGNIIQLFDLSSYNYTLAQGTEALRPQFDGGGGPNSLPRITFSGTTQRLVNTGIALASNKALSYYAVVKQVAATQRSQCQVRTGADESSGDILFVAFASAGNQYLSVVRCHSQAEEADFITVPAADANWHVLSTKYAASVAPVFGIDDVPATPTHSSSGTCGPVETIMIGNTSGAGGEFYLFLCAENVSAGEDIAIRTYIRTRTGVG